MSEQSDDIIKNIDAFYEKVKEDDKKALILLSIQNWLYNIIKFDEITGDEIYSSLDEMLYATQYYFDTFDKKTAHDFLSIIINYVENTSYYLINHLNSSIVRQYEYIHFGFAKEIDGKSIQKLATKPGRNIKEKLASDPRIYAVKKQYSYDIIENRVLKTFLHNLKTLLDIKLAALGYDIENNENNESILFDIINSFLQSDKALSIGDYKITKVNNVLLRDKHYKKIWKSWSRLKDLDYIIEKNNQFLYNNIITYMYYSIISMLSRTENYYTVQTSFKSDYEKITEKDVLLKSFQVFNVNSEEDVNLSIKNNVLIYSDDNEEIITGIKNNVLTVVRNIFTDEIIESGNQKIKKEYAIITKTYEITNENIHNLIKELYNRITGFNDFKKDIILEPLEDIKHQEVCIDICSNKPEFYFNNKYNIIPFRLLIQKQHNEEVVVDCKISKAVYKKNTSLDMVELFYKNSRDKDSLLEFNGREIFFNNLKDYLHTEELVYLLPDALDTIKIFETKHIISYINFVFNSSIRLPRSIAAVLGEKAEENKTYFFIDFVYDCPYITKIQSKYSKDLEKNIEETKGIYFERHYTKIIEEWKEKDYNQYTDLIVHDNDEIILPRKEKHINKIDYNIIKKYIIEDSENDFVIICNNIKLENAENTVIKETNIKDMLKNCQKFYEWYKKLLNKDISIWYDYLPQLALICIHSDGYYYELELIGKDKKINPYAPMEKIEIKNKFTIPAKNTDVRFPLLMGKNFTPYEAYIKLEKPFEEKTECDLELTYSYGKEEPYQLYFIPTNNPFNRLEVEWKEAKIENRVPEYPQIVSWDKLTAYPNGIYEPLNLLELLIKRLGYPKYKIESEEKLRKSIRFCCYRIWENGKSIFDRDCPNDFREKIIDKFIQKYDNNLFSNSDFFDFIAFIMHKDMPKTAIKKIIRQLDDTLSLSEDKDHKMYTSIGHALGDISQNWQKEILRKISHVDISKANQYVRKALLRIISIAIWNTENTHREIYSIFSENNHAFLKLLITEDIIYDEIEKEFNSIRNKIQCEQEEKDDCRQLLRMYDLLFGLMLFKDADKFPDLKNMLDPTSEIIAKYIQQLDKIWKLIVTKGYNYKSENLNSFIKFVITNMPEEFKEKNVPEIFFAVRSYLTGNFNGSTITIKEFNN